MFAKLYETKVGQILVKVDSDDNGAEVRLFFEPKGLGVCSVSYNWPELPEDEQWDMADETFESMSEDLAIKVVSSILDNL